MFTLAEHLAKDDLLIINCRGKRAIQPEYEDYFYVQSVLDWDVQTVSVTLQSMWDSATLTLFVPRWEWVEVSDGAFLA